MSDIKKELLDMDWVALLKLIDEVVIMKPLPEPRPGASVTYINEKMFILIEDLKAIQRSFRNEYRKPKGG